MLETGLGSVRELANKAGLSQSIVSQWLAYKTVTPQTFEKIAIGLSLDTEQLRHLMETQDQKATG